MTTKHRKLLGRIHTKGMTLSEFSKRIGISQSLMLSIIVGEVEPSNELSEKIAKILNIDIQEVQGLND